MDRKLRMGMVGGGNEAYVGAVHRRAAWMEGKVELVCGAFSSTRRKSLESGLALMLPKERIYGTYREMFRKESKLPEDERMDFVTIVTPNNMHYPVSMAALDAGFHVVCDEPMTLTLDEATNLERKIRQTGNLFCLTQHATAYPMVKEARQHVLRGKLGEIRRIVTEYPQGWLSTRMETAGHKQAAWRTDPRRAGASLCMGNVGARAERLAAYVTGLKVSEVCADLTTFVPGRPLDDDASALLRYENGARGVLWASQIAVGEENGLSLRVYGDKGSLFWRQEDPSTLIIRKLGKPAEIRRPAGSYLSKEATDHVRVAPGRPEGYIEALANIYNSFTDALCRVLSGKKVDEASVDYPTVQDGLEGVAFVEAVVKSSNAPEKWTAVSTP